MIKKKIIVGTASLGLSYGLKKKRVSYKSSIQYLKKIYDLGFKEIDTSPAYGNSNIIIKNSKKKFVIYTKLTKKILELKISQIENFLMKSLKILKVRNFEGILIQNESIMLKEKGKKIFKLLEKFKKKNFIKQIGVSSYNFETLRKILKIYKIDFVQVPFNIFDQRLLDPKNLNYLRKRKVDIHVRSIFLQGLLILGNNKIPNKFKKYQKILDYWNSWLKKNNLSSLDTCLNFVLNTKYIKKIVIGCANYNEFKNLKFNPSKRMNLSFKYKNLPEGLYNPIKW